MTTTRRKFLKLAGGAAALVGIGKVADEEIRKHDKPDPPLVMGTEIEGASDYGIFVRAPDGSLPDVGEWGTVTVRGEMLPGMYVGKGWYQLYGPVHNLEDPTRGLT